MRSKRWLDVAAIEAVVKNSSSTKEVLQRLGITDAGVNYKTFNAFVAKHKINVTHFMPYTKGFQRQYTLDEMLVINSQHQRSGIKTRLIKEKRIPYICAECDLLPFWNGKSLSLQLEHKNGINDDYRIENLEFLCPNCHTQTKTFGGRNKKRKNNVVQ